MSSPIDDDDVGQEVCTKRSDLQARTLEVIIVGSSRPSPVALQDTQAVKRRVIVPRIPQLLPYAFAKYVTNIGRFSHQVGPSYNANHALLRLVTRNAAPRGVEFDMKTNNSQPLASEPSGSHQDPWRKELTRENLVNS